MYNHKDRLIQLIEIKIMFGSDDSCGNLQKKINVRIPGFLRPTLGQTNKRTIFLQMSSSGINQAGIAWNLRINSPEIYTQQNSILYWCYNNLFTFYVIMCLNLWSSMILILKPIINAICAVSSDLNREAFLWLSHRVR